MIQSNCADRVDLCSKSSYEPVNDTKALTELLWAPERALQNNFRNYTINSGVLPPELLDQFQPVSEWRASERMPEQSFCREGPIPGVDPRYKITKTNYAGEEMIPDTSAPDAELEKLRTKYGDLSWFQEDWRSDCGALYSVTDFLTWQWYDDYKLFEAYRNVDPDRKYGAVVDRNDFGGGEVMSCQYGTAMESCVYNDDSDPDSDPSRPARAYADIVCLGMAVGGTFERPALKSSWLTKPYPVGNKQLARARPATTGHLAWDLTEEGAVDPDILDTAD